MANPKRGHMSAKLKTVKLKDSTTIEGEEVIRALIHELQNYLHSATMEVELAQLGVVDRVDSTKLRRILESFTGSLRALRELVLPSEELTREDPITIVNSALAVLDEKFLEGNVHVSLHQRGPMPTVELHQECARNALERILRYCYRRSVAGGELRIMTGAKLSGGNEVAEIAITLIPSSVEDNDNDDNGGSSRVNDTLDIDMFVAMEILKRYGPGVTLERDDKKQSHLTVMMHAAP
jgi:hypothetical protein